MTACWQRVIDFLKNEKTGEPVQYSRSLRRAKGTAQEVECENLLASTDEQVESTATNSFVTEAEIHHISQGNWDYLVEEQKKKDEVVDRKLRQEEEALRRGQEAMYAKKRAAAQQRKSGQARTKPTTETTQHTSVPLLGGPTARSAGGVTGEDFDQFLASVQARTTALSTKNGKPAFALSEASDSESEEVDFGFWEKASDEDEKTAVAVVS